MAAPALGVDPPEERGLIDENAATHATHYGIKTVLLSAEDVVPEGRSDGQPPWTVANCLTVSKCLEGLMTAFLNNCPAPCGPSIVQISEPILHKKRRGHRGIWTVARRHTAPGVVQVTDDPFIQLVLDLKSVA